MSPDGQSLGNEDEVTLENLFNPKSSDGIEVTAVLCNHVEISHNLLYILGGGINHVTFPSDTPKPWYANLAIGIVLDIPWTETSKEHEVTVSLIDDDSQIILFPVPDGSTTPIGGSATFNLKRSLKLPIGTVENVALAFNYPGLPLPRLGTYIFAIGVDGSERKKIAFTVYLESA